MILIICVILSKVQYRREASKFHQRNRFITDVLNAFEIGIYNESHCSLLTNIIN